MHLKNKSTIVTGAASGIGRAIALKFAAEGAVVIAADIDGAAAESVAEEIRFNAIHMSTPGFDFTVGTKLEGNGTWIWESGNHTPTKWQDGVQGVPGPLVVRGRAVLTIGADEFHYTDSLTVLGGWLRLNRAEAEHRVPALLVAGNGVIEVTPIAMRTSIHAESLFWWASGTLAGWGSIEAHGQMEIAQDGPSSYWRFQEKTPSTWHREDIRVWDGIFHWPYVDMQTADGKRVYAQRT